MASMVAAVAPVHLFGALAPELQDDLGFGDAAQGLAVALYFGVSASLSSWGGGLTDRIGPSPALRGAAAMSAIGALILMTAPAYAIILVGFSIAAVGNAISQPGTNTFISGGVSTGRRGLALGMKQSAVPISTGLAGLALPVIAVSVGWRWAFLYAIAMAFAALALIPHVEPPAPRSKSRRLHRPSPALWLVTAGSVLGGLAVAPIGIFLVRSLEDAGFTPTSAGLIQAVGSAALVSTRIGWGALMDRTAIDRFRFVVILLAVGALAYPMLAFGDHRVMVVGALLAFGAGWSWPGVAHLAVVEQYPGAMGGASGVLQAGMFTGATIGPAVFGIVADVESFAAAWLICGVSSATGAVLVAMGGRRFSGESAD